MNYTMYGIVLNAINSELSQNIDKSLSSKKRHIVEKLFCEYLITRIRQEHIDINSQGCHGETLLHFYCGIGHFDRLDCIKLLIENGANIFIKDKRIGITPLQLLGMCLNENIAYSILLQIRPGSLKSNTITVSFPISLVELLLEKYDKTDVIHQLLTITNIKPGILPAPTSFDEFLVRYEPMFETFLFLHNHPESKIRDLFASEVEKHRDSFYFHQFFEIKNHKVFSL